MWNLQHFQEKLCSGLLMAGFNRQIFFKFKKPQIEILVGEKIDLPIHMKISAVHYEPVLNQKEN